jgi:outer membrane protein assembly factor BamB
MRAFLMTVLLMFYSNSFASSQIQKGAPWPMFGRNQLHTSNSPFNTGILTSTPQLRWKLPFDSHIESSPSIGSDGTIYFGTDSGILYAVNREGAILWTYKTGGSIPSTPALSVKDMIFFGSWDRYIYALQASTGTLIWRYKVSDVVSSSPVIDDSNTIYLGAGNTVYAILDTGVLHIVIVTVTVLVAIAFKL